MNTSKKYGSRLAAAAKMPCKAIDTFAIDQPDEAIEGTQRAGDPVSPGEAKGRSPASLSVKWPRALATLRRPKSRGDRRTFPLLSCALPSGPGGSILHPCYTKFLIANREEILGRSREAKPGRLVPTPTKAELVDGLPLFLDQLVGILRLDKADRGPGLRGVSESAGLHGGALLRIGLTVAQVTSKTTGSILPKRDGAGWMKSVLRSPPTSSVHVQHAAWTTAVAELAVTAFERQRRPERSAGPGVEHLGFLAHEMRNLLGSAILTFEALSKGTVGVRGSTGTLHGRTLRRMRVLIDRTLAEVRLGAGTHTSERVSVAELIEEIEVVATIEANDHDVQLSVDGGSPDVVVEADQQHLASVVANLVQHAFKFTRPHGHITLTARTAGERVLIEVQDECGGLPPGKAEDLFKPFEQRGDDKTGMGLGLSISLKGVQAIGGEIHVRDLPGSGCMFTVDLPRAPPTL